MASRPSFQNRQAVERLRGELSRLREERDALSNQIRGIERAIQLLEGTSAENGRATVSEVGMVTLPGRRHRAPIKDTVLTLVMENATVGLNAASVVKAAEERGVHLDRASVSSLLSRLKKDGILSYDGNVYRPATKPGG